MNAAGAADIGELVHLAVGRHAAQRVAAVPRGDLEGLVDVVDRKATRCMPISLGRVGSVSIASGWMYSKSPMRPLPSGVSSMAAWLPSRPTAVSVHSPPAENGQSQVGKEDDRCFEIADGDVDVLEFDGHALHAIELGRLAQFCGPLPA
jgi:hypothetical protein